MVIKVYVSGMSGNKEVKKRQQRVTMIMDSKHIEYTVIDITEPGQEGEKDFMQANAQHKGCTISDPNPRHALPPQLFNDTEYCGDYDDFDMANEVDNLEVFLKLAAPEVEAHKNGATTAGEEQQVAPGATDADEDKENKTEDNTDGGAVAAEDATEDGANENTAPEAGGAPNDVKEAPAEDTSTAADGGADGEKEEEEEEENVDEPLSAKQDDGKSDGNEQPAADNLEGNNDKTANAQVVADVTEESKQADERSVVEPIEIAAQAVNVDTAITHKDEHDHDGGERENPESKDAVLVGESDPHENDGDGCTTNNDEKSKEEETPANTDNGEQHESTAVSVEKDTEDAEEENEKQDGSLNEDEKEASVEEADESETSESEQDSQNGNNVSRPENETNLIQEQSPVDTPKAEDVLQKVDSVDAESLPGFDEEKDDIEVDSSASLMTSPPIDATKENEADVQLREDPVEIEPSLPSDNEEGKQDGSEAENSTKPDERSSAEEPLPVETGSTKEKSAEEPLPVETGSTKEKSAEEPLPVETGSTKENSAVEPLPVETGSTKENSSTPTPPSAAVEEPPSAVEMDADPDDEEQELLKTSAALAGKSEDAAEIDIEEEAEEEDEAAQQPGQDDAGEDGISSKLVDTDDPMLAEQEQEE